MTKAQRIAEMTPNQLAAQKELDRVVFKALENARKAKVFKTMTVTGSYGQSYRAKNVAVAAAMATLDGYEVLDATELGDENILVVAP